MTEDDCRPWRAEADAQGTERVDRLSAFVESQSVEGVYEVIEVVGEYTGRPDASATSTRAHPRDRRCAHARGANVGPRLDEVSV